MKTINLTAWFLLGTASSSLLAWAGMLAPATQAPALALYGLLLLCWVLCWLLDDVLIERLSIDLLNYRAILIASAIAFLFGGLVQWLGAQELM